MRYLQGNRIFPMHTSPVDDHVLVLQDDERIEAILPASAIDPALIEHHAGYILPGFVNAHCHLELSHLLNVFPEKTGLPGFLSLVIQQRNAEAEQVQQAMRDADAFMWQQGIAAVGDISNVADSFQIKAQSKIAYHTFIELFAFDPARVASLMEKGKALLAQANGFNLKASLAPHAPYSINEPLVEAITTYCATHGLPTSVHMLESNDENELYVQSTGLFRKLYREMGLAFDQFFTPTGKTSLASTLPWFHKEVPTLLVHNTIATSWDAEWAEEIHPNLFWCMCPNANRFIEDRLPDIPMLQKEVQYITIGTDSLASNHQLSIASELQTIHTAFPEIHLQDLFRWATYYGAKALNMHQRLGSFETGKQPGVIALETNSADGRWSVTRLTKTT
jgi:cytosine/adenosine deaminase-related metal-dependent hydrolase